MIPHLFILHQAKSCGYMIINYCIFFFKFHLFALQHNCQGRQDGLRRTLRDTVKQCFINPHHIYIYIRWGRKGSRGPQGQGNTKCPHTLRSLTPHRLSLAHKTLCLRRDHDNNTTKLKNTL